MNVIWHPGTKELEVDGTTYSFTVSECEVIDIYARAFPKFVTSEAVAVRRGISASTTRWHIMHIHQKLGVEVFEVRHGHGYRLRLSEPPLYDTDVPPQPMLSDLLYAAYMRSKELGL